jgi:hypothetical protein
MKIAVRLFAAMIPMQTMRKNIRNRLFSKFVRSQSSWQIDYTTSGNAYEVANAPDISNIHLNDAEFRRGKIYLPRCAYADGSVWIGIDRLSYKTAVMDECVLRFVRPNMKLPALSLFNSGIIEELFNQDLIPETKISDYYDGNTDCVLTQRKVTFVPPRYYSFSMLKECLKHAFKMKSILSKHDCIATDPHFGNMTICESGVKYLDIGSICPLNRGMKQGFWNTIKEYMIFPMLARMIGEYRLYRFALSGDACLTIPTQKSWNRTEVFRFTENRFINGLSRQRKKIYRAISENQDISAEEIDILFQYDSTDSMWSTYQTGYLNDHDSPSRFKRIVELFIKFTPDARTVIDVAGNSGYLCLTLEKASDRRRLITMDYCEDAIEKGFIHARKSGSKVIYMLADAFSGSVKNDMRVFKSDCVFALAITRHLIFRDHYNIDFILDSIKRYARKYVYIEFMPKGLYAPGYMDPPIPEWYDGEWFLKSFERHFRAIHHETLEANRELFIGEMDSRTI